MKKVDLKPYFDALAATFDKKIHEGQGYQIFDQSDNVIDLTEGSPAEYLESLTGKKLPEEVHGNHLYDWGQLSEINNYFKGEPAVQEELIYSYDVAGSNVSFYVLKLFNNYYVTKKVDGAAYHLFRIEFNEDEVDFSSFIVDYDTFNSGTIRNQMIVIDAKPIEMDTRYVKPDQLEKEYRELMNELYQKPDFRIRINEDLIEKLQAYKMSHYETFLDIDDLEELNGELQKNPALADSGKLANLYFKVIFANYR